MTKITDNVRRVEERIEAALSRAGRAGDRVAIVGVTKTFGPETVDELVRSGVRDVGENRIQEFLGKCDSVTEPCRWHLIGHLQRNKATKAIGRFHLIHSIDGVRIAQTLDRLGGEREQKSRVLVQVNTSEETAKHGLPGEELVDALGEIAGLGWLEVMGLMTIGPATMDPAATRACFRGLRTLRDRAERELGVPLPELSMGMSADFEIAIEEGATIVRLGRILTGERAPKG